MATCRNDIKCVKVLLHHNCEMMLKGRLLGHRGFTVEFTYDPIDAALEDRWYDIVLLFLDAGYRDRDFYLKVSGRLSCL